HARRGGAPAAVFGPATERVWAEPLLQAIRDRAARGDARFVIIAPQSDPTQGEHPDAERRLRRALAELRGSGVGAHGWGAQPDPVEAAKEGKHQGRSARRIVSTSGPGESSWLGRDLVQRRKDEPGVPVEHVMSTVAAPS